MDDVGNNGRLDRRDVLRRGAVLGGMVAWSVPAVQTIAGPAFAAGSPRCVAELEVDDCTIVFAPTPECCECIANAVGQGMTQPDAVAWCADQQLCVPTETCGEEITKPPPPVPDVEVKPAEATAPATVPVAVPTVVPAGS
jgi:hypothetical protein